MPSFKPVAPSAMWTTPGHGLSHGETLVIGDTNGVQKRGRNQWKRHALEKPLVSGSIDQTYPEMKVSFSKQLQIRWFGMVWQFKLTGFPSIVGIPYFLRTVIFSAGCSKAVGHGVCGKRPAERCRMFGELWELRP
jgi:hypothetical protein